MIGITNFPTPRITNSNDDSKAERHIGLLVFQECSVATTGAIGEVFRLANALQPPQGAPPPYRLSVLSDEGGFVVTSSSIPIWTQRLERYSLADFHALFVAGCDAAITAESNERLLSWITQQGFIASSGIRQGASVAIVRKTPLQATVPVFLFDDGPDAPPTHGVTPTEMALTQIERDLSADTAQKVARAMQAKFAEHTRPEMEGVSIVTTAEKIRASARWMHENYSKPISVAQAAESAAMSKRNYQRRFKDEFGTTPLEYLLRVRFDVVITLLRTSDLPVDKIARRCGMGDGNRLGRLFKERYGMSPTHFRARQPFDPGAPNLEAENGCRYSTESLPMELAVVKTC